MKMQKGIWTDIDGVMEQLLKYLIKHQKLNKKVMYVVLLDLKNAFGDVHHSLICFALEHHHVPAETIELIMSQYSGFFLNVSARKCCLQTGPIHVQTGVIQGYILSPLLFNLVF